MKPPAPLPALANSGVLDLFDALGGVQAWIKDRRGRYQWVNRAFLLNYSLSQPGEVLGRTDADLSPGHLAEQFRLDDEIVLRGTPISGRVELVGRYDHTASWSLTHKVPVKDASGKICGTAGTTRLIPETEALVVADDARLSAVVAGIRAHVGRPLGNPELAAMAGLSVRALERRFRALFHLPPQQYVRRMRVRMACQALVYSGSALAAIAGEHGFCDQSHFTREFRKETGMTPREYRQRYAAPKS